MVGLHIPYYIIVGGPVQPETHPCAGTFKPPTITAGLCAMTTDDSRFDRWMEALEARHLADLTFPEVSRALRALSSAYVQRRSRLAAGAALDGAGKRAAFALFYGPLHYLLLRNLVRAPPGATRGPCRFADLGCGTGAAGAGWAGVCGRSAEGVGIDRHPWALAEA